MPEPLDFAAILDAAEELDRAEQAKLVAILQRRHAEQDRLRLAATVAEARREFAWGHARVVAASSLKYAAEMDPDLPRTEAFWLALGKTSLSISGSSGILLRTRAFGRSLYARVGGTSFGLKEVFEQLAAEAEHPTMTLSKQGGPLQGCRAWRVRRNFRILFEPVEHGGRPVILPLALDTSDDGYQ